MVALLPLSLQLLLLLPLLVGTTTTTTTAAATAEACRDRRLWPYAASSLWNTPIGSAAKFVPANLYPPSPPPAPSPGQGPTGPADQCAYMREHPANRSTCPGAHGGINASHCEALGCCFASSPSPDPHGYPWCFTPTHRAGPTEFHNDAEYFVVVGAADPLVEWVDQGWWGPAPPPLTNCSATNCWCHCERVPASPVFRHIRVPHGWTTDQAHPNNGATAMLQPDNITVLQMQPTYRCSPGAPVLSRFQGCPNDYPNNQSVLGDGVLGAHGGSGLSALGGMLRAAELDPASGPIRHALKLELFAHQYYYGLKPLNNHTPENQGRTQYVWPAVGSDGYTWNDGNRLRYNGTNPHLAPGALLAIPAGIAPTVNTTTVPGARLKQALTQYGGYLVDDTAGDSAALCMEAGSRAAFQRLFNLSLDTASGPWYDDLVRLFQALHIVVNNGPHSIGGGGTPLAPLAPEICPV